MKRLTALFLAAALLLSLTACGGGGGSGEAPAQSEPAESDHSGYGEPSAESPEKELESIGTPIPALPTVPDFQAFSNGHAIHNEDEDSLDRFDDRYILHYEYTSEAGDVLIPEYIRLLTDSGAYTFQGSFTNPDQDLSYYWFSYNGSGDVATFSLSLCNIGTNMQTIETGNINLFLADIDYTDLGSNRNLTLHASPDLEVSDTGARTTYAGGSLPADPTDGPVLPVPTPEPTPAPTPVPTPAAPDPGVEKYTLPSLESFFYNTEYILHDTETDQNGTSMAELFVSKGKRSVFEEYIELLQDSRFGLELTATGHGNGSTYSRDYYAFTFTDDPGSIKKITIEYLVSVYTGYSTVTGNVIIEIARGFGSPSMSVYCPDGVSFADTGDRTSDTSYKPKEKPSDGGTSSGGGSSSGSGSSSGGGSSSGSSSSSGSKWYPCTKCFGDGEIECSNCDGDGGKWVYDSVPNYSGHSSTTSRTWDRCFKCGGTGEVTCPRCGGEGRLYY